MSEKLKQLILEAKNLEKHLRSFITKCNNLEEEINKYQLNSEELYQFLKLSSISEHLQNALQDLKILNAKVITEGVLLKNPSGRYELNGRELTAGSLVEICIEDEEYKDGGYYFSTRIEHNGEDYYVVDMHNIKLEGRKARIKY